jgi:chemotaxis protein CheY-P-specific phosphatase CheC
VIDHRRTFVKAGAVHAAGALARLADCPEPKEIPPLQERTLEQLEALLIRQSATFVFAGLEGAVRGVAGIAMSPDARDALLERLLGAERAAAADAEGVGSALSEAGNIAVSAAAGALGHLAGGVVVPSVPQVSDRLPEGTGPSAFTVSLMLGEPDHPLPISFVWIPAE